MHYPDADEKIWCVKTTLFLNRSSINSSMTISMYKCVCMCVYAASSLRSLVHRERAFKRIAVVHYYRENKRMYKKCIDLCSSIECSVVHESLSMYLSKCINKL